MRMLDWLALIISIAAFIGSVFWAAMGREGEVRVEITAHDEQFVFPLTQDSSLVLDGPVGETHVEVKSGIVFIEDSDCRDKLCVAMGQISTPSSWVGCLPNRVFVRLAAVVPGDAQLLEVDSVAF